MKNGKDKAARDYARIAEAFAQDPRVSTGDGRGFGAGALKANGRIFAMLTPKGDFVVKLPAARVSAMTRADTGTPFTLGGRRVMKEWLVVRPGKADPLALAKEALAFVASGAGEKRVSRSPVPGRSRHGPSRPPSG